MYPTFQVLVLKRIVLEQLMFAETALSYFVHASNFGPFCTIIDLCYQSLVQFNQILTSTVNSLSGNKYRGSVPGCCPFFCQGLSSGSVCARRTLLLHSHSLHRMLSRRGIVQTIGNTQRFNSNAIFLSSRKFTDQMQPPIQRRSFTIAISTTIATLPDFHVTVSREGSRGCHESNGR